MKKFVMLGTGLSVALSVASVAAESDGSTFHALSNIARGEQGALTPMRDANLAIIEGGIMPTVAVYFFDLSNLIRDIPEGSNNTDTQVIRQTNDCRRPPCGPQINMVDKIRQ
jgi:hypothetical protein